MKLVIDASVWVASSKADEGHYEISLTFIQNVYRKNVEVFCPWLVLAECASAIFRSTKNAADHTNILLARIEKFPNMTLVSIDEHVAHESVNIVKMGGLRGADSICAALAKMHNATLVAWDKAFLSGRLGGNVQTTSPSEWLAANG